jgi:hypothetical protein
MQHLSVGTGVICRQYERKLPNKFGKSKTYHFANTTLFVTPEYIRSLVLLTVLLCFPQQDKKRFINYCQNFYNLLKNQNVIRNSTGFSLVHLHVKHVLKTTRKRSLDMEDVYVKTLTKSTMHITLKCIKQKQSNIPHIS